MNFVRTAIGLMFTSRGCDGRLMMASGPNLSRPSAELDTELEMGCEALAAKKPVGIVDRRLVDFRVGDFWHRIGLVNFAKPNRGVERNECPPGQAELDSR